MRSYWSYNVVADFVADSCTVEHQLCKKITYYYADVLSADYRVIEPTTLTFNTNGTQLIAIEILENNPNKNFTISIRNETSAGSVAVFPRTLSVIIVDNDKIS